LRIAILEFLGVAVLFAGVVTLFCVYRAPTHAGRNPHVERGLPVPEEVPVIERRTCVKNQLARRVIAERTPLLEAVEWFRQVNGEVGMDGLIRSIPGRSAREKLCRQVIMFVAGNEAEMERDGYSPSAPRVSVELSAELDRLLAAGALPPEPGVQ
jgi:hypothetical protein